MKTRSSVLETGEAKIKSPECVLSSHSFVSHRGFFFTMSSHWGKDKGVTFMRLLIPFMTMRAHELASLHWPHILTNVTRGINFLPIYILKAITA